MEDMILIIACWMGYLIKNLSDNRIDNISLSVNPSRIVQLVRDDYC